MATVTAGTKVGKVSRLDFAAPARARALLLAACLVFHAHVAPGCGLFAPWIGSRTAVPRRNMLPALSLAFFPGTLASRSPHLGMRGR